MKKTLEKLWDDCFAEECALIDTEEEKELIKKAVQMRKTADELLTREQSDAVEKYIEALYDIQISGNKKAFFKGCEFAISFLFEATNFERR